MWEVVSMNHSEILGKKEVGAVMWEVVLVNYNEVLWVKERWVLSCGKSCQ